MASLNFKDSGDNVLVSVSSSSADTMTFTGPSGSAVRVAGVLTPTLDQSMANKTYVDTAALGLSFKASVKAATTVDVTLSGTQTIDGIALVADDRVLVKNQDDATENGVYVVAAGAWSRATDLATGFSAANSAIVVAGGSVWGSTRWVCTNDGGSDVVGTDALVFVQFGRSMGSHDVYGSFSGTTIDPLAANTLTPFVFSTTPFVGSGDVPTISSGNILVNSTGTYEIVAEVKLTNILNLAYGADVYNSTSTTVLCSQRGYTPNTPSTETNLILHTVAVLTAADVLQVRAIAKGTGAAGETFDATITLRKIPDL